MQFYTYVWYDQDWIPYYVGKGVGYRSHKRRGIPHPEEGHVVLKYFDLEEQAFEHEKQLIAFWGRRGFEDEGLLMNKSIGGPGMSGVPPTKLQTEHRRRNASKALAARCKKYAKEYFVTDPSGTEYKIKNLSGFCKDNDLSNGCMYHVMSGKYTHHKGWKCRHA